MTLFRNVLIAGVLCAVALVVSSVSQELTVTVPPLTAAQQALVANSVQLVTDTNTVATAGTLRYYVDGTNSYIEVGMKTGTNTVGWVEIMKKSWSAE